jgi:ABC-type transporter Mla subunit MlaD
LTQLPAASQLNGEARNQVSQLITNFNELITTQANWKASYDKVSANLTTLLGADNSDAEAAAAAPTAAAGAAPPAAVGTAGTATMEVDPAIRAKLVELRKSLNDFKKAAGGEK